METSTLAVTATVLSLLNPVQVGILAAVVTEVLKFVPFLRKNDAMKALTAFVVALVGTFVFTGFDWVSFGAVFASAFVTYKALLQPMTKTMSLKTQV